MLFYLLSLICLTALLPNSVYPQSAAAPLLIDRSEVTLESSSPRAIVLRFTPSRESLPDPQAISAAPIRDTGECNEDSSDYPYVSRLVVVPPTAGLHLTVDCPPPEIIPCAEPPSWFRERNLYPNRDDASVKPFAPGLYPELPATMGEPIIVRGVRMVRISVFPLQYDSLRKELRYYPSIETGIELTADAPVNPSLHPLRRGRSVQSLRYLEALVVNRDALYDDYVMGDADAPGSYLIVIHENLVPDAMQFIEWRRRCGYRVEILPIPAAICRDTTEIKNRIQQRYNAWLDQEVDPFDNILIIGDRMVYINKNLGKYWVIEAPAARSVEFMEGNHADYIYACLEGNDEIPDAAITRWPSGHPMMMSLATKRTLAYEADPYMNDPSWFTRGGVFSQHWGNTSDYGWHASIHTTARYGKELLKRVGFDDIAFYEDTQWDQMGSRVGPNVADLINRKANIIIGRLENYNFRDSLRGVDTNNVYPIYLAASGHGEVSLESLFRVDHWQLKGITAGSCFWGNPTTTSTNAVWLEMINAFLLRGFTLGWSRVFAATIIQNYIPNFQVWHKQLVYDHVLADFDVWGDPALRPWIGVPHHLQAEYDRVLTPNTNFFDIQLTDTTSLYGTQGAIVTLYVPGKMPQAKDPAYASYNGMRTWSQPCPSVGGVRFMLGDDILESDVGTFAYITVTGEGIVPIRDSLAITQPRAGIVLTGFTPRLVSDPDNTEPTICAGEEYDLFLEAQPTGGYSPRDLTVSLCSCSPYVTSDSLPIPLSELSPAGNMTNSQSIRVRIAPDCPDGAAHPEQRPLLIATFKDMGRTWQSAISLDPIATDLSYRGVIFDRSTQPTYDPSHSEFSVILANHGRLTATDLAASLTTTSPYIRVASSYGIYPMIPVGIEKSNGETPFRVFASDNCPPHYDNQLTLHLYHDGAPVDTVAFTRRFGAEQSNRPEGPDNYGYYCYDNTDTSSADAPKFRWIEISTQEVVINYYGSKCQFSTITDANGNSGATQVVPLPFITRFYGRDFDTVSICSNGFITMGNQGEITNFQNWPLDRAIGAGIGTIAPFWDKLKFGKTSQVYYYADKFTGRFIIEWYKVQPYTNSNIELTFELVLYDRDKNPTASGDQPVLFQYKLIENSENVAADERWTDDVPYASVGISSPSCLSGLSYTFNNQYPPTSAPLVNRRAIKFQTFTPVAFGRLTGIVTAKKTGRPVEGASLFLNGRLNAVSGQDGTWSMDSVGASIPLTIVVNDDRYLSDTVAIPALAANQTLLVNTPLGKAELSLYPNELRDYLQPNSVHDLHLWLANSGDGAAMWSVEERLVVKDSVAAWADRGQIALKQNHSAYAMVYADGHFYVCSRDPDNPHNNILTAYSPTGTVYTSFRFPVVTETGVTGLAYDGYYLWGIEPGSIVQLMTNGRVIARCPSPDSSLTTCTYDNERRIIWFMGGKEGGRVYGMDSKGKFIYNLPHQTLGIVGVSYIYGDRDGYPLYLVTRSDSLYTLSKYNPRNGNQKFIHNWKSDPNEPIRGFCLNNEIEADHWLMVTLVGKESEPRLDLSFMDYNHSWFKVLSTKGAIGTGNKQMIGISLNTRYLPIGMHNGEVLFRCASSDSVIRIPVTLEVLLSTRRDQPVTIPDHLEISGIYPNPFNGSTTITYFLPGTAAGTITIFDINGRIVERLAQDRIAAGLQSVTWNASKFPSGVYLIRLDNGMASSVRKVVLIR